MKGIKDFWERIKVCHSVLTKRNYAYFGVAKNPFIFDENGKYVKFKSGKLACFVNTDDMQYKEQFWGAISEFADKGAEYDK